MNTCMDARTHAQPVPWLLHLPIYDASQHGKVFQINLQYPKSPEDLIRFGFHSYHCYNFPQLDDLDSYLRLDAANGIESAAILWGSESSLRPLFLVQASKLKVAWSKAPGPGCRHLMSPF